MKPCTKCGTVKPLSSYRNRTAGPDGKDNICRECRCAYDRDRWANVPERKRRSRLAKAIRVAAGKVKPRRPGDPEKEKLRKRRWQANHRHSLRVKSLARLQLRRSIDRGVIRPPSECSWCGTSPVARDGRRLIQGHHHRGYEFALDVIWLCPKCHRKADDAARKDGAA